MKRDKSPGCTSKFLQAVPVGSTIPGSALKDEIFDRLNFFKDRSISHSSGTCTPPSNARPAIYAHDTNTRQFSASHQYGAQVIHNQTTDIKLERNEKMSFQHKYCCLWPIQGRTNAKVPQQKMDKKENWKHSSRPARIPSKGRKTCWTDSIPCQKISNRKKPTPVNKEIPFRSLADQSQARLQRATALDVGQNESERQYIDQSIIPKWVDNLKSTIALNTAICFRNVNELKNKLERKQKSNDYSGCTGEP